MNTAIPRASHVVTVEASAEQERRLRRRLIDAALGECETANAAGTGVLEPWVLVLTVELQQEQGCGTLRIPHDPAAAHDLLLDLQAAYLCRPDGDLPPADALRALAQAHTKLLAIACGGQAA